MNAEMIFRIRRHFVRVKRRRKMSSMEFENLGNSMDFQILELIFV